MVKKMTTFLKENGFTNITYDYCSGDSYYFEGYSDVLQEIRVDIRDKEISIFDRYITEKHYVHFGSFKL
ncbi:hypothetical protein [Neobacillus soli]|uniref:hypothetical protein n=1 Tax=Neobacillus soli TaxID=220688 RepID=UPI000AB9C1D2|nr:hypothetical protein [Neobacillus soli]